jgi:hypothetical protein
MKQREVQGQDNTIWSCIQAFAGSNGDAAKEASQKAEQQNDNVTVICTPSGGAQTIRLDLPKDWAIKMSDDELINAISASQDKS